MTMSDYLSVRSAAGELSVADQLRLIDDRATSMPDDHPPSLSKEWFGELDRRSAEIEPGEVQTESWLDVRQRLMRRVGLDVSEAASQTNCALKAPPALCRWKAV
jgi:putative addiction module component (TIGR02574 family)